MHYLENAFCHKGVPSPTEDTIAMKHSCLSICHHKSMWFGLVILVMAFGHLEEKTEYYIELRETRGPNFTNIRNSLRSFCQG